MKSIYRPCSWVKTSIIGLILMTFTGHLLAQHSDCNHFTCMFEADTMITIETMHPFTKKWTEMTVEVKNDKVFFEKDICLGTYEDVVKKGEATYKEYLEKGVFKNSDFWPNATIPYQIDPTSNFNATATANIISAIATINASTNLNIVLRTTETTFVNIDDSDNTGCYVLGLGMHSTGALLMNLGTGCTSTGTIIHEFVHLAGFAHEQNRSDRNNFVTIVWANIQTTPVNQAPQFTIADVNTHTDIGAYDYASVMHYSATAFSSNGQATIVTPNGQAIGSNTLSAGDIAGINALYPVCMTANPSTLNGAISTGRHASVYPMNITGTSANEQYIWISSGSEVKFSPGTELKAGSEVKASIDGCF